MEPELKEELIQIYSRHSKPKYQMINVTSKSSSEFKALSPFFLGPVTIEPYEGEKLSCNVFENAWQYSKIYKGYEDKEKYLTWAKKGFEAKKANRFPMGRGKKPLHSLYKGNELKYIEARKKIYCPLYEFAVLNYASKEFDKLKEMAKKGISIFDYDGYDNDAKCVSLKEVLNDPYRCMGHAFVLKMMLVNKRHWLDD